MFVAFMTCLRYSRGSLVARSASSIEQHESLVAYDIVVETFTLFSHSNSVHILRNWNCETLSSCGSLGSMRTHLRFGTVGWLDIVHDVNVNIVQDYTLFCHARTLP